MKLKTLTKATLLGTSLFAASAMAQTEISFWTMQLSPTFDDYINGVIADFEAQNPDINVKWVDVPWSEMEKKMLAAVASKTAPDVANLNPQFAAKLGELGALTDAEQFVAPEVRDSYLPNVWNANKISGKTIAVPWYLSTTVTIYNKGLFEQAGAQVPSTYVELPEAAAKIRENTGKYAYFPTFDGSHAIETMVTMGGELLTEDGKHAGFNTPAGLQTFEYFTNLYQQGLIPKSTLTEGHSKAVDLFQSGELAMLNTGPQFLNIIKQNSPALYEQLGVGYQLSGPTGKTNIAAMNVAVPELSKHKEEAYKFALFLTNAENQVEFDKIVPILPSVTAALDDPYFTEMPKNGTLVDEARLISAKQLREADVLVPAINNYNKLRESFVRNLQSAMLGRSTPEKALEKTVKSWDRYLK